MAPKLTPSLPLLLLIGVILLAKPAHAFGAGNIASVSKIEGSNWRHGDIEDALLTIASLGGRKFSKMDVKRVYFGNWLRDYSQAVDVGTVKYVSAEAIRLLLWVLGFMSFGYGTGEFEVTRDRLGCYRPEEHIDNPKDYADNIDARQYDRRLRAPVEERRELSIDERTGLKHYIATEDIGITTSAGMVKDLYAKCIQLGRRYDQSGDKRDFYEALRLMGTANHCLEDYSAHSNYTELALIELGERNVFPHVGRRTQIQLQGARGPVYPIVTGTFGGVDFLHSVMGELSDKATQSEMQDLEGTISQSKKQDTSLLKQLLNQIPSGILGGDDHAGKADQLQANAAAQQMQGMHISPKEPEAFTRQVDQISKQIYPILEFHDNIIQKISEAIDKIPILPDLLEQLQEQVNIFVFSLLAPYVMPIIKQVKTELATGSSEVIQSSQDKQLIVFHDDNCSDPTHSMLSKDHFSNVLNEPAGKIASNVIHWVVPQIVACWDNPNIDINRTVTRIVNGVFHHPALNQYGDDGAQDGRRAMFGTVANWWQGLDEREKNDLRNKLSREGVQSGRNHKEGVHDSGHGCGKPLGMPSMKTSQSSGALGGIGSLAALGGLGSMLEGGGGGGKHGGSSGLGGMASSAVGGGALGSLVGGLVEGAAGGDLLGSGFDDGKANKQEFKKRQHGRDGSVTDQVIQTGHHPGQGPQYGQTEHGRQQYGQQHGQQQGQQYGQQYGQQHGQQYGNQERFGQAAMSQTQYPDGGYRQDYQRYEQDGPGGQTGYGFQQSQEVHPTYGGGYEQRVERRYEHPGGRYEQEVQEQRVSAHGRVENREEKKQGYRKKDSDDDSESDGDSGDEEKKAKKQRKRAEKEMKKQREHEDKQFRRQSGSPKRERRHSGGSPKHERQHSGGGGGGGGGGFGAMFGGGGGGFFGGGDGPGHRGGRGGGGPGHRGGRGDGHGGGRGRGSRDFDSSEYSGSADEYQQEMRRSQPSYENENESRDECGEQSYGGSYEHPSYGAGSYGRNDYGPRDYAGGYGRQQQQQSYGDGDDGRQDYGGQQDYPSFNYEQQYDEQRSYGGEGERYGEYDRNESYGQSGDSGYGPSEGGYGDDEYERRRW